MDLSTYTWNFGGSEEDKRCERLGRNTTDRETDELTNKVLRLTNTGGIIPAAAAAAVTYVKTIDKPVQTTVALGSPQGWVNIPSGHRYRDASEAGLLGCFAGASVYLSICLLGAMGAKWIQNGKPE